MASIDGSEKSSRSKADYFEVLVACGLAMYYDIKVDFSKEIEGLKNVIIGFEDGEYRVAEQEQKAEKTLKKLIRFLTSAGVVKIKNVKWVGRFHQTEHTLSDVDITNEDDQVIGISLKAVRAGTGTQKNLGLTSVKKYLSIDIEPDLKEMWENIKQELVSNGLKEISEWPQTKIKDAKYIYPIIREIGKKFGLPIQKKAAEQSIENFNSLSSGKKISFLKCVYGVEEIRRLLNVLAQENEIKIYWNEKFDIITKGENLFAKKAQDISYYIEHNDIIILRIQASFTNGIGISPFCERAFLANL